jgi:AmiR/NasT family two-component response regulator
MDVHIGDLHNGVAIVDEIRRESSELSIVPIVVVTSSKDESVHNLAMECGASGIIVKPLTRERLLPLLPQLLPGFSALAD